MPRHLENRVKITVSTLDGSQHVTCGHSFPFQLPPLCDIGKQNSAPRFEEISFSNGKSSENQIKHRCLKHVYAIQTLEIHRRLGNTDMMLSEGEIFLININNCPNFNMYAEGNQK